MDITPNISKNPCSSKLHIIFSLCCFLQCLIDFAQTKQIDSLKNILPLLKDTSRIDCLNELSFQYTRLLIRDSAEYFESVAYNEAEKINYVHGVAESISNQSGIVEYFDNDFPKSEMLANQSIGLFKKTSNKKGIEKTYNNLLFAIFSESKFDEAFPVAVWLYRKYKLDKDSSGMHNELAGIGTIYFQKGNYDSAFYFLKQAQDISLANKTMWVYQMIC